MDARRVFGQRLKDFRVSRGLTQERLAEKIDRSVDALSKLERGVGFPSLETVLELSKHLQIPLAKLLASFERNAPRTTQRLKLEARLEALLNVLDDRQLAIAVEQMKALTRK
jgi:transcriptional regulator with XRE-family HTH domain